MFAVILTGGKQYLVEKDKVLKIEKILGQKGEVFVFDKVLLTGTADGSKLKVGNPYIQGAKIMAEILEQKKDKKISVIKFKRKVRYKRNVGHRQNITVVRIKSIE